MKVYQAINAVQTDLSRSGISKDRENSFDKYKFRGIDDVYNALAPLLAKHGLCILPRILKRDVIERESQKGGALFYVTVEAEFDFVCAEDGSKHTVRTFGEAMDRGDKATNKAMSAAYKYAAFQAFAIPTEADNDADAHTHEVKPSPKPVASKAANGVIKATDGAETLVSADRRAELDEMAAYMVECHNSGKDMDAIGLWYDSALENDERVYLWQQLGPYSKLRSAIKANKREAA